MLHGITIDKIQDFLTDNSIGYYMNWDDGKIEIDLGQDDIKFGKRRAEIALSLYKGQTKNNE